MTENEFEELHARHETFLNISRLIQRLEDLTKEIMEASSDRGVLEVALRYDREFSYGKIPLLSGPVEALYKEILRMTEREIELAKEALAKL